MAEKKQACLVRVFVSYCVANPTPSQWRARDTVRRAQRWARSFLTLLSLLPLETPVSQCRHLRRASRHTLRGTPVWFSKAAAEKPFRGQRREGCYLEAIAEESGFTMLFVDGWFSVNVDSLICGNEKQRWVIMGTSSETGKKTHQKTEQPRGQPNGRLLNKYNPDGQLLYYKERCYRKRGITEMSGLLQVVWNPL